MAAFSDWAICSSAEDCEPRTYEMNDMTQRLLTGVLAISLIGTADLSAQRGGRGEPTPTISAMATMGRMGHIVRDGMLQPVTEFADTTQWIRTRLWVETDFDTD